MLFSAFATVIGMLALNGLPRLYHPSLNYRNAHRATDDRFLLVIEADDPKFDPQRPPSICAASAPKTVEVVEG